MSFVYEKAPEVFCCSNTVPLQNDTAKDERMRKNFLIDTLKAFLYSANHHCDTYAVLLGEADLKTKRFGFIIKVTSTKLPHANPDLGLFANPGAGASSSDKVANEKVRFYVSVLVVDKARWLSLELEDGDGFKERLTKTVIGVNIVCGAHSSAYNVEMWEDKSSTGPLVFVSSG
ncbi:uncharacterized protein RCO7_03945 [Rhynchosporium graminicola]|uniref:Uncharacterized protein n=1 Tax=Rhynchosporium graminicola TaxID=2792576 RepID=A0A1E1L5K7_9HELO|nr:uncharacterized protein RCO7_03945 [Rhynchosporium commune]